MAKRMRVNEESVEKGQDHQVFSVKPFYDMLHTNSYIKPTTLMMNGLSSCTKDGVKRKTTPRCSEYPSAFRGDGRSFQIKIAKCYANYLFALRLPLRIGALLPCSNLTATFICNGKRYNMNFLGKRKLKMFGSGWRQFAEEQKLVEGDCLNFKIKESSDTILELNVNILKCTVSTMLHEERRGTTINHPIDVEYDDDEDGSVFSLSM